MPALAQPFEISQVVIAGGSSVSTGGSFGVAGTVGQTVASEESAGGTFGVEAPFWPPTTSSVNTTPTISSLTARTMAEGATLVVTFTVADVESLPDALLVSAASSNGALVPAGGLTLAGTGSSRTLTITPAAGEVGTTTMSITAEDPDGLTTTVGFALTVNASPPTITITSPTVLGSYASTTPFLAIAGTAAADDGLAGVAWTTDRGASGVASGTTSWTATVPLFAGTNVVTITATDDGAPASTSSATLTVTVADFRYYLAEGATGSFWDLDLALANPNNVSAPVTITFLKGDATTVSHSLVLAPTSRTTIPVETIDGLANTATSAVVTSTAGLPLAVERSMFWANDYRGSHGGTAVPGPATRWYFAEGSQGFFDTYVLLANANATPGIATVQFLLEGGGTVTRTIDLPPTSRVNVVAGEVSELVGKSFSIVVDATVPIIAERAMYFGANWSGGHESAGVTSASTSWFLAEGATGYFAEYVLIGNPNPDPAHVTLTYLLGSGQTIVRHRTVSGHSRLTVPVDGEAAELADAAVSAAVTADIPVVVERAMYWPATNWSEAHNSFGVTETGLRWGLAEGRVGGPHAFATYVLLANPQNVTAQVRVTFLRTDGTTVVKQYDVAATSRFNIEVNSMVPELQDEAFAVVVEVLNGVPIVVERAMYNDDTTGRAWAAGTNATAVRLPD